LEEIRTRIADENKALNPFVRAQHDISFFHLDQFEAQLTTSAKTSSPSGPKSEFRLRK